MSKLNPLALKHLLVFLEKDLASLLPPEVRITCTPSGEIDLCYQGQKITSLTFQSSLEKEEIQRWKGVVQALIEKSLAQFVREKIRFGAPKRALLFQALKEGELQGLLLKCPLLPSKDFYYLGNKLYFLPQTGKEFLLELWRIHLPCVAINVVLKKPEDLDEALRLLKIADFLDFSWLSNQGAHYLENLGLLEADLDDLKRLSDYNAEGKPLLWAEGPNPSLHCLGNHAYHKLFLSSGQALFAFELPLSEVVKLVQDLSLRGGVLPGRFAPKPLALLWASFEHARRLPKEEAVVFEPYSMHALGDVYLELGDLDAARKSYFWGLLGSPQLVDLLNSLAVVMIRLGDRKAARFFLSEAVKCAPSDPLLRYNLALFLEEEGLIEEGLQQLKEAVNLAPEETIYAEALARHLARKKDWPKIRALLYQKPLSGEGYYLLAKALYETGELEEALRYFKKALESKPEDLMCLAHLALLFIHLRGEYSLAEAILPQLEEAEGELKVLAQDLSILLEEGR